MAEPRDPARLYCVPCGKHVASAAHLFECPYFLAVPGNTGWIAEAKRYVPSSQDRTAYFTRARTSVAEQVSHRPLSSRLIDVAALAFLRGLALVGWVKRRVRW